MNAFSNQPTAAVPDTKTHDVDGDVPTPADFKTASQSLLRSFFSTAKAGFGLLRRYKFLMLALALLGAALAWAYRLVVAPRYEYTMLVQCNGPSRTAYTQVFEQLNSTLLIEKGDQRISLTGIQPASSKKVIRIKTSFPDPLPNSEDSSVVEVHRMLVVLRTTEAPLNTQVQNSILHFVNSADFLRTSKKTEVGAVQEELRFINAQLQSLDSLHRSYTTALARGAASATQKESLNEASTYQHGLALQQEKSRLQTWLAEQSQPATVVVPFYLSKSPIRPGWWVLLGAVAGSVVAFAIALLQWLKKWSVGS